MPATRIEGDGPRVLVVDDNVDACTALTLLLRAHGCEVMPAHDIASTLSVISDFSPAAVILDLHLPDGHGVDLMQRLRDNPSATGCLFIALSGDEEAGDRAMQVGFHHVMVKPADIDLILEYLSPLRHT